MESPRREQSRKYYLENKERVLERVRADRERNRKTIRAKMRSKYANDVAYRKSQKAYQVAYRRANREKVYSYQRKYRNTVLREWHNEYKRNWIKTPKGKALDKRKAYKRRARLNDSIGNHTLKEWLTLLRKYGWRCAGCRRRRVLTVDHIRPLSKGGDNTISNIQPLCRPCNAKKGNKYPYQFKQAA